MKTDTVVVSRGGQQATTSSSPTMSLNGREEEPDKESKAVVESQNRLSDDEEELCRICRNPGEEEHPLYYPCACKGSMKFTHEECHLQWLNYRSTKQCDICKRDFSFQYVYAENAPSRLPLLEFILGLALKASRWMRVTCEILIADLVFVFQLLFVIPFMTAWLWRLVFVRDCSKAYKLIISRCTPGLILMDWFDGISLVFQVLFRSDLGVLVEFISGKVFERLRELWLERVRARRQHVVEVHNPWLCRAALVVLRIITPFLMRLLIKFCVELSLALTLWMFPSLGDFLVDNPAMDRYGWLAFLGVGALWYGRKRIKQWLPDLHDSIRDDKYLIGKMIQNLE